MPRKKQDIYELRKELKSLQQHEIKPFYAYLKPQIKGANKYWRAEFYKAYEGLYFPFTPFSIVHTHVAFREESKTLYVKPEWLDRVEASIQVAKQINNLTRKIDRLESARHKAACKLAGEDTAVVPFLCLDKDMDFIVYIAWDWDRDLMLDDSITEWIKDMLHIPSLDEIEGRFIICDRSLIANIDRYQNQWLTNPRPVYP